MVEKVVQECIILANTFEFIKLYQWKGYTPVSFSQFESAALLCRLHTVMTELWKITHMGACEIIRIFMFSELLLRGGSSYKKYFKNFLVI